jgi:hypothetical protein
VTLLYAGFGAATGAASFAYRASTDFGQVLSLTVPLVVMLAFAAVVLRRDRDAPHPPRESA